MARLPMFLPFAVRRAAHATIAAGKAVWEEKGLLLVGGAAVAAWLFRADLRRLARHLFSYGRTHSPVDRDLRKKAKRDSNKGARKDLSEVNHLYTKNHGRAGGR